LGGGGAVELCKTTHCRIDNASKLCPVFEVKTKDYLPHFQQDIATGFHRRAILFELNF